MKKIYFAKKKLKITNIYFNFLLHALEKLTFSFKCLHSFLASQKVVSVRMQMQCKNACIPKHFMTEMPCKETFPEGNLLLL